MLLHKLRAAAFADRRGCCATAGSMSSPLHMSIETRFMQRLKSATIRLLRPNRSSSAAVNAA
jgi:hypothetical protein